MIYTADNICKALGLSGFANDPHLFGGWSFRILFKPSLGHAEFCVTLRDDAASPRIAVHWFEDSMWHAIKSTLYPAHHSLNWVASLQEFASLREQTRDVAQSWEAQAAERHLVLDGLGFDCVLTEGQEQTQWNGNLLVTPAADPLVRRLLQILFDRVRKHGCRKVIADTATYVALDLPLEWERRLTTRMFVVGCEDERNELLGAINGCTTKHIAEE